MDSIYFPVIVDLGHGVDIEEQVCIALDEDEYERLLEAFELKDETSFQDNVDISDIYNRAFETYVEEKTEELRCSDGFEDKEEDWRADLDYDFTVIFPDSPMVGV